ncbi:MAG: hypothetical protein RL685_7181 [Pseudomonadota bacterium]|jgi:GNAT superfamily N-acetyltransferase
MSTSVQRELEQAVVESWPAAECLPLDGWLLGASGGPTHRGNTAVTLASGSALSLEERLARTEAWYRERGQLARVQIGPCASPAGLDVVLERRGYQLDGAGVVMTATASGVLEASGLAEASQVPLPTRIEAQPGAAWSAIAAGSSRFASWPGVLEGYLARLGDRASCATAWVHPSDGEGEQNTAAAMGLGIRWGRWLGVYAMHTRPEQRRRGAARALLFALARHAQKQGTDLYLMVEPSNVGARALYAQCGFQDLYQYHYRLQGEPH